LHNLYWDVAIDILLEVNDYSYISDVWLYQLRNFEPVPRYSSFLNYNNSRCLMVFKIMMQGGIFVEIYQIEV